MKFKVALPNEKNDLPLLKEVLSKGGYVTKPPEDKGHLKFEDFLKFLPSLKILSFTKPPS